MDYNSILDLRKFTLNPPQREAIDKGLEDKGNWVFSMPTGSGKTLLAEIPMLNALSHGRKVVYLCPLRALAGEKHEYFLSYKERYKVTIRTGDFDSADKDLVDYDLIISTYEKFDSIMRHKAEWLPKIGCIAIDEVHSITDPTRGPTLEILLTRLREKCPNARLILLSAVMRNAEDVAKWIGAELIQSEWRPVPLYIGVAYDGTIYWQDDRRPTVYSGHNGDIADLALDTVVNDRAQSLVFCHSRKSTVQLAQHISRHVEETLTEAESTKLEAIARVINDEDLSPIVARGVAFHNAGLDRNQRSLVESGFRDNLIKVVCATTTLAQGINMPARRVIMATNKRYIGFGEWQELPIYEFKNMAGRAGRPGLDPYGECLLYANSRFDLLDMQNYANREPEPIESRIADVRKLYSHILATIKIDQPVEKQAIEKFFSQTFGAYQNPDIIGGAIDQALQLFKELNLSYEKDGSLYTTLIGSKISELYISPLSYPRIVMALRQPYDINNWLRLIVSLPDWEARGNINWAAVLDNWINEFPKTYIAQTYKIGTGDMALAAQLAEWLVYSAKVIASLHHSDLNIDLEALQVRVKYGVRADITNLCRVRYIGRELARRLHKEGITDVYELKASESKARKLLGRFADRVFRELK